LLPKFSIGDAMSFEQFTIKNQVMQAVKALGFTQPTEIQEKTIPVLQQWQGDFVGQAQTGTGKTAAFLIPLLEQVDFEATHIQALILAPTRELARQIHRELEKLAAYLPLSSTTIYGGVPYDKQLGAINKGKPQIIVGTPGRVIDLLKQRKLDLSLCQQLIIDEADEMLNMGFIEDVQTIIDSLEEGKRMWMFSATMPDPIIKLIEGKFSKPKRVSVAMQKQGNGTIKQHYCVIRKKHYADALLRFIDVTPDFYGMIFCETRHETKELSERLLLQGISVVALHGELNQTQRDAAMKRFSQKRSSILICTDVAARGIDVSNLTHVINMGLPRQSESYIHRIGRTGRAGLDGKAISFMTPAEINRKKQIESLTGQKMIAFALPHPTEIKTAKIKNELKKMDGLKVAIVDRDQAFNIDDSFEHFVHYMQDLSKEQMMKLLFSYHFNSKIRQIDESSIEVVKNSSNNKGGNRNNRRRTRGSYSSRHKPDRPRRERASR
jgi:ATP-dependent RNA helicase DeaD